MPDQIASLRLSLEAQRRQGIDFDQAWSVAITRVPNSGWRTRDVVVIDAGILATRLRTPATDAG